MPITEDSLQNIELAKALFQRGIAFCLYRFPGTAKLELAAPGHLFNASSAIDFIIAPFSENSAYKTEILKKITLADCNNEAFEFIYSQPATPINWGVLPEEKSKQDYLKKIAVYLQAIDQKKISKAILSRTKTIAKPAHFDPFHFFRKLSDTYPETFCSLYYLPGKGMWAGATTELLLNKKNDYYYTMALAGTQPRKTKAAYNWRKKEQEEHRLVQQHIEEIFKKHRIEQVSLKGPYTIQTGKVAHLRTDYIFRSKKENIILPLIKDLHPTPAIGGLPVKGSLNLINETEGYDRRYYSGYLGEMQNHESAGLYINLRCMQIGEKEIALYIGGGISEGSDAEEEWEETNQKSLTLLEIMEAPVQNALKKNEII